MAQSRHFLGWDEPVIHKVVAFLLPHDTDGLVDLSDNLIVVPTRQAGRRLRRALAQACASRNTALLSASVVTHNALLRSGSEHPRLATGCIVRAVWARLLIDCDLSDYPGLFPTPVATQDFTWAVHTADLLQGLRHKLADGGYGIRECTAVLGSDCPEPDRWRDLALFEAQYLDQLEQLGLVDPLTQRIHQASTVRPPAHVRRVVVAAVPDPTPLVVRALDRIAEEIPVVVLVHAPPQIADAFDPWGRPCATAWRDREVKLPQPERNLLLAGTPTGQSQLAIDVLAQESDRFGPDEVTIGVPDADVIPLLVERLAQQNLAAFNPGGESLSHHPLFTLLDTWRALFADRMFEALSRLLRHADVLEMLRLQHDVSARDLLEQVDRFQNRHLPRSLKDVQQHLYQTSRHPASTFPELEKAFTWVKHQIDQFESLRPHAAIRGMLQDVYTGRSLRNENRFDDSLAAVAAVVNGALDQIADSLLMSTGLDNRQLLELLVKQLTDQAYYEQHDDDISLEGWLELLWNDAPLLVVTGMNEGRVPDSGQNDLFLPDSVRQRLGLHSDADRVVRDAYQLQSLIASRQGRGRVCFIVGKTSGSGDPLKPTRLLFRCGDDELPTRAAHLFGVVEEPQDNLAFNVSFKLQVQPPPDVAAAGCLDRISVTAIRDYLACPFRFYLSHVLGMKPLDDRKTSLDALDFGSLVHHALQLLGRSKALRACRDESKLANALCKEAQQWVDLRFGPSPPLTVMIQLDAAKQRLAAAARHQVACVCDGWETIQFECPVTGCIDGMTVSGRVDRVDRHRETGALRLLDYKTSDTAKTPAKAHLGALRPHSGPYAQVTVKGRAMAWHDLQLPLYRSLLTPACYGEETPNGPIEVGYFNLPMAVAQTGIDTWDDFNEELLTSAVACAAGVVGDILHRRFWPPAQTAQNSDHERLFHTHVKACVDSDAFGAFMGAGS